MGEVKRPYKVIENNVMIYNKGALNSFRCDCGCNVFHKAEDDRGVFYGCNACNAQYTGQAETGGK